MEYKVVNNRTPLNEFQMNQYAREGWQLITAIAAPRSGNCVFYFVRKNNYEPLVKG